MKLKRWNGTAWVTLDAANADTLGGNTASATPVANQIVRMQPNDANLEGGFYKSGASPAAPTGTARINYSGYLYATKVYNAIWNDFAEFFERGEATEPGDIIALNRDGDGYVRSQWRASTLVRGVHSDTFGSIVGGNGQEDNDEKFIPVGLAGRVRVKLLGPAKKGDYVISSDLPGIGIAVSEYVPGAILGQVEENKASTGVDRVNMFIMRG